jgi:hypothetical protein
MRYDGAAHVVLPHPLYFTQVSFDSDFLGKLYNPIVPVKITAAALKVLVSTPLPVSRYSAQSIAYGGKWTQ